MALFNSISNTKNLNFKIILSQMECYCSVKIVKVNNKPNFEGHLFSRINSFVT